jgi:hypothetical protein
MRTTLDIADDVLFAANERARRENKTAGEVISELVRQALTAPAQNPPSVGEPRQAHGIRPFAPRGSIVTNDIIARLRSDDAY